MEAVVFCGIQASGKTTFFAQRFLRTHVRVSMDLLRTRHREQRLLDLCVETRQPFVVDNTNPTRADRARYVEPALCAGFAVVAYWFDAPPRDAIARNEGRLGRERIPIPGLLGTARRLEVPALAEGFARVWRVTIAEGGGFAVEEVAPDAAPGAVAAPGGAAGSGAAAAAGAAAALPVPETAPTARVAGPTA